MFSLIFLPVDASLSLNTCYIHICFPQHAPAAAVSHCLCFSRSSFFSFLNLSSAVPYIFRNPRSLSSFPSDCIDIVCVFCLSVYAFLFLCTVCIDIVCVFFFSLYAFLFLCTVCIDIVCSSSLCMYFCYWVLSVSTLSVCSSLSVCISVSLYCLYRHCVFFLSLYVFLLLGTICINIVCVLSVYSFLFLCAVCIDIVCVLFSLCMQFCFSVLSVSTLCVLLLSVYTSVSL